MRPLYVSLLMFLQIEKIIRYNRKRYKETLDTKMKLNIKYGPGLLEQVRRFIAILLGPKTYTLLYPSLHTSNRTRYSL